MLKEEILKEARNLQDKLVYIRRELHKNPELAYKEFETSKFILKVLKDEGIDEVYSNFHKTSVMAIIRGEGKGKTILLRADMDALKIDEKTGKEYASINKGVMHACGHDAHITWVLGATILLNKFKKYIKGNIKIIFQPAEEGAGGADELLKTRDIIEEEPKAVYAIAGHVWPSVDSGSIGIVNGCAMASANFFKITINGKGGHGATPHKSIDPIAVGNLVYTSIQNIVSRTRDPLASTVISIGRFTAEGSYNIIPDTAVMEGTIRAQSIDEVLELSSKIEEVLSGICKSFGAEYKFNATTAIPAVVNNENLVKIGEDTGKSIFGDNNVNILNDGCMTAEDFSYYLEKVPGLFVYIGNRNLNKGISAPLHNSCFDIDEDILFRASAYFTSLSIDILETL